MYFIVVIVFSLFEEMHVLNKAQLVELAHKLKTGGMRSSAIHLYSELIVSMHLAV